MSYIISQLQNFSCEQIAIHLSENVPSETILAITIKTQNREAEVYQTEREIDSLKLNSPSPIGYP